MIFYILNNGKEHWEIIFLLHQASTLHCARLPYKIIAHDHDLKWRYRYPYTKTSIKCHQNVHSSAILKFSEFFFSSTWYCKIEHSIDMWSHTKKWIRCHKKILTFKNNAYTFQYLCRLTGNIDWHSQFQVYIKLPYTLVHACDLTRVYVHSKINIFCIDWCFTPTLAIFQLYFFMTLMLMLQFLHSI